MFSLIAFLLGTIALLTIGTLEKIRSSKIAPHMFPELKDDDFKELKRLLSQFGNRMCIAAVLLAFVPVTKDNTIVAMLATGWCFVFLMAIITQGKTNRILKSNGISYRTMVRRIKERRS